VSAPLSETNFIRTDTTTPTRSEETAWDLAMLMLVLAGPIARRQTSCFYVATNSRFLLECPSKGVHLGPPVSQGFKVFYPHRRGATLNIPVTVPVYDNHQRKDDTGVHPPCQSMFGLSLLCSRGRGTALVDNSEESTSCLLLRHH